MSGHALCAAGLAVLLAAPLCSQSPLPGTAPLSGNRDFALEMVESINDFLVKETAEVANDRQRFWNRDFTSAEAYARSIEPNRSSLRRIVGAVDERVAVKALSLDATTFRSATVARGRGYKVTAVRLPVFDGVDLEGLLLEPDGPPIARVVAIPDADWSPESIVGLSPGVDRNAQFARRLAESGCQVIVPVLIDRMDTWSGIPGIKMTNQPHREWIYRMSFEAGRHIIGYEIQKVLAAVDWFASENTRRKLPIGVAGYAEGGLMAFYAAALDHRIGAALVSGYFQPREALWKEPVYRDVWGLLREFGDAEIAGMVAPRSLIVEASRVPEVTGPPPVTRERSGATPNGMLTTPSVESVSAEIERARPWFAELKASGKLQFVASGNGAGLPGSDKALSALLAALGTRSSVAPDGGTPETLGPGVDPADRLRRQFDQLVEHTQRVIRRSPDKRAEFWKDADSSSPDAWRRTTRRHRDYIWDEVIGRMPNPRIPANARTRLIYEQPRFRGYEVVLDVWDGIFAQGILLVPKDMKPGERRAAVVCQHGLEGRAADVADPSRDVPAYHRYAARLAELGFVTYAPQNPYIGQDRFRLIQRKGHPLKLALFSFIVGQHQRLLEWLGALPFVDSKRIGFYGLSYGGKTAMRVPPLLDGYALSICSADFNEWVWKNTSVDSRYSYLLTNEYDMIEFDLANVANYAELAMLIAPRPFMVERGHADPVAPDEWVAYEFARVRRFYATRMKLPERTEIEFFDGPHTINGQGTFDFLKRHLAQPSR